MKKKHLLVLIVFFLTLFGIGGIALADKCPHCGLAYPDVVAPGDEAYIASIRAQHEAECYAEKQAASGWGAPEPGISRQEAEWNRQQEWIAEQERIRRQQEIDRKARIERLAQERADAQARRLEWEQKKQDMFSKMKGESAQAGFKSSTGGEVVELKPEGTSFFGLPMNWKGPGEVAVKVGGERTPLSAQQLENARRALWLYQKAAQAGTDEEAHFLAAQAADAMLGHPLRVKVPASGETPQFSPEKIAEFREVTENVESNRIKLDEVSKDLRLSEDKKNIYEDRKNVLEEQIKSLDQELAKPKPEIAPTPAPTPGPSPEAEKKKEKEDLTKELMELKKLMEENEKSLNGLKAGQKDAENDLAKSEKKFREFTKK